MARLTKDQLIAQNKRIQADYDYQWNRCKQLESAIDNKNIALQKQDDHIDSLKVWCGFSAIAGVLIGLSMVLRVFL